MSIDSQGGSQPVTFSFIKTAANTWAYEASYAGNAANLTADRPDLDKARSRSIPTARWPM